jgi:hypothetical protein
MTKSSKIWKGFEKENEMLTYPQGKIVSFYSWKCKEWCDFKESLSAGSSENIGHFCASFDYSLGACTLVCSMDLS